MAKNVLSLQLLRNSTLFGNYAEAVSGITGAPTNDGTIKLARYNESGTTKTIFGIYHDMNGGTGYTIYDADKVKVDGIVDRLDALDGGGQGEGIVDQKIASAISALDYIGVTTGDGVVVTNVTETSGVVAATAAEVGTLKLAGYTEGEASGKVASTDSLNEALAKLQNQIDAANESKNAAIEALGYTDTAVPGNYVSKVDQTNGKISVTRDALPTVAAISEAGKPITAVSESLGTISATAGTINAEYVNVADAGNVFTASTVEAALAEVVDKYVAADTALKNEILGGASASADTLGEIETLINNLSSDAATYTIRKDTESLPATIKERYTLVETKNGQSTDKQVTIDIAKDSHIVSIRYISDSADTHYQNLEYKYLDVNGVERTEYVDISSLVLETEFGSGVTVTNHVAHGVVDTNSEGFLTVGANGFKLAGVQTAINNAIDGLDSGFTAATGQYITAITEENGLVTASAKQIQASEVAATPIAESDDTVAVSGSTVADQIASLGQTVKDVQDEADKAHTKVAKDNASAHLTLTSTTDADGATVYTIGETDVASKAALDAEIAARKAVDGQNGDTYAVNTAATYISGASSLNDADIKLDAAIKNLEDSIADKDANVSGNSTHVTVNVVEQDGAITEVNVAEDDIASAAELDTVEDAVGLTTAGTHVRTSGNYTSGANTVVGEIAALDTQVRANADNIAALSGASLSGVTVNTKPLSVANNVASITVNGKTTEATADGNKAIIVETDANGNLTLGLAYIDVGEY